jgi:pre-mRNA-splicing factor CDC5/CEF1
VFLFDVGFVFFHVKARQLLDTEMNLVKKSMGHGDINLDGYSKVWDECYSQVLFLPSRKRFTRANAASKKDRIESAEQKLEVNRQTLVVERRSSLVFSRV